MRKTLICVALGTCSLLHGCGSSKVQMSGSTQQNLANQKNIYSAAEERTATEPSGGKCVDYVAETEVSEKSLTAWRLGLAGKVDEAMKMLEDLDKKYPNMKTVSFMKGQVQEHAGHKEEALKYYKQAVVGNEFDAMEIFKLAELERETGKTEQAISDYQKLLKLSPAFAPGQLGLAKAFLKQDSKSAAAKQLLQQVVDGDPEAKEKSAKEATELLKHFGVAVGSGKSLLKHDSIVTPVSASISSCGTASSARLSSSGGASAISVFKPAAILSSSAVARPIPFSSSSAFSKPTQLPTSVSTSASAPASASTSASANATASASAKRHAPKSPAPATKFFSSSGSGSVSNFVANPITAPSLSSASSQALRPTVPLSSSSFSTSPAAASGFGLSKTQSAH